MSRRYARYQARCWLGPAPRAGYCGVRLYADDRRCWDAILSDFKVMMPPFARRYDSIRKMWFVSLDYTERLEMWLYATFDADAIDDELPRADRRSSSSGSGRQRQEEPPKARQPLSTLSQAYKTLHLADDAPLAVVEASWRVLSKQHHPDAGGSEAGQKAINAAVALIRDAQARRAGAA